MQKSILLYLSKLEGFKTAIKNCHWAAKSMNAHEFMDSLEDIVSDHQDLVAEVVQGAYNTKIKVNDFKPKPYKISTFTKLVSDIYNAADKFYATIQGNKRFIGLRSVMEDFMAKMQQQAYLNAMCTESTMKVINILKENTNSNRIRLTEDTFTKLINKTVVDTINEGKWLNRAAGLALGAASLFGGANSAYADGRGGMPETYGDNVKTAVKNLKKAGMKNVRDGKKWSSILSNQRW